jgi:hypothetical protein
MTIRPTGDRHSCSYCGEDGEIFCSRDGHVAACDLHAWLWWDWSRADYEAIRMQRSANG